MDGNVRINPYLAGNFAPIRSEDDFDLTVSGEMPAGLRGALFRIGPNPQFEPATRRHHHWFGGDGDDSTASTSRMARFDTATATSARPSGSWSTSTAGLYSARWATR